MGISIGYYRGQCERIRGVAVFRRFESGRGFLMSTRLADSHLDSYPEGMVYTVAEAKNKLPELIKQAEAGNPVTITKRRDPEVEFIRKVEAARTNRVYGVLGAKKIVIDPDWARPQEDTDAWLAGDV